MNLRWIMVGVVSIVLLSSTVCVAAQSKNLYQGQTIQGTKYGYLEGMEDKEKGVFAWLGVPYAKAPVGSLRWRAPQELEKWEGTRAAKSFGAKSAQLAGKALAGSEDCLYLNIWRPATEEKNLPVLVFVHGGGNFNGSGETFKGDILAKRTNSIIISVNYRLGALGWLNYSGLKTGDPLDDSGNYGLLDIISSLKWVQGSIVSFGGNPHNVTLSGQSAGARDALGVMISPLGKGLFQKVIALSGGLTFAEPEQGEEFAEEYIKKILVKQGVATDLDGAQAWLASHSKEEIAAYLRAQDTLAVTPPRPDNIRMAPFPHLFKDGYVIPKEGAGVIAAGKYNQVPIILGSMSREFAYYMATEPYFAASLKDQTIFQDAAKLHLYNAAVEFGGKMFAGFTADRVADELIKGKNKQPVYAYRFAWGTNEQAVQKPWNSMLGAAHAADVDFYTGHEEFPFKNLFPNIYYTDPNKPGRQELSQLLAQYIKNFLYTGNPNGRGLVQWDVWSANLQKPSLLELNADATHAYAVMSKERFDKTSLQNEMKASLTEAEWQILSGKLMKGRFFWEY